MSIVSHSPSDVSMYKVGLRWFDYSKFPLATISTFPRTSFHYLSCLVNKWRIICGEWCDESNQIAIQCERDFRVQLGMRKRELQTCMAVWLILSTRRSQNLRENTNVTLCFFMSSSTRTTPTQTQRGQILGHYQAGTSIASISHLTGVKEKTIYGIIERYKKRGNVDVKPHTGRPSVVTPRGKRQILKDITNDPWHTVKQIAAVQPYSISESTVRRIAHSNE